MTRTDERLDSARLRRFLKFCAIGLALVGLIATIYSALLVPILVSLFLTYLLEPLVIRLERRMPRRTAVGILVIGGVSVLSLAAIRFVPLLYRQVLLLVQLLPGAVNTAIATWLPLAERYVSDFGFLSPGDVHQLFAAQNMVARFSSQLQLALNGVWHTGASVASSVVNVVLIPVLTFFLLKDLPMLRAALKSLVPMDLTAATSHLAHRVSLTLRSVLKGQAIVALIVTGMYVVGLTVIGLQSAIAIGVVAGVCRVIPYFDVIVGGILSTVVLLSNFGGWGQVLSVVLVFLMVQAIDGAFVTPAVIGERVGLHPVLVILSVIALGDWLGFWGVLLAVPIAAVTKVLIEEALPYYRSSKAYSITGQSHLDE